MLMLQESEPDTSEPANQTTDDAAATKSNAANDAPRQNGGAGADSESDAAAAAPDPDKAAEEMTNAVAEGMSQIGDRFETFFDNPTLDNAVALFGPMLLELGQAIFLLVVLVVIALFVSKWIRRLVGAALKRARVEATVATFLSRVAQYAIWILLIPIALELFGVEATSLAAVIGAAGLAIGLGMQGALSNIAAGVVLLVLRPVRIGDYVEIQDEIGEVQDMGIFYTVINAFSKRVIYVPNSEVLGNKIENLTGNKARRIRIPVGVAYGTDLAEAKSVLEKAVTDDVPDRADDPAPRALLEAFGASSINFNVDVFCPSRDYLTVRDQAVLAINNALEQAEITIPFPQRTLSYLQGANNNDNTASTTSTSQSTKGAEEPDNDDAEDA